MCVHFSRVDERSSLNREGGDAFHYIGKKKSKFIRTKVDRVTFTDSKNTSLLRRASSMQRQKDCESQVRPGNFSNTLFKIKGWDCTVLA